MSDFVYHAFSKRIYKRLGKSPRGEVWTQMTRVLSRDKKTLDVRNRYLIDIPSYFSAYIKSDTAYHGLKGRRVDLEIESDSEKEDFFNLKKIDTECLWFVEKEFKFFVPSGDIDFTKIQEISPAPALDDTPPMPSLEELQKCSVHYEGRKTILTYYDGFVGEAICHRDDEFNVESGIALAYSRAKEAKDEYDAKQEEEKKKKVRVGDIVKVVDVGTNFSTNYTKVLEICQKIGDMGACARYAYGDLLQKSDERNSVFKVLYVDDVYAYIEDMYCEGRCRLIRTKGIAKPSAIEMSIIDGDDWEEDDWDWLL